MTHIYVSTACDPNEPCSDCDYIVRGTMWLNMYAHYQHRGHAPHKAAMLADAYVSNHPNVYRQ